jgi:hypothetical protein
MFSFTRMKICGYILAFYLILLSIVPCCLFDDCRDYKTEHTSHNESGNKDCGNCSPFFNCEGCATATIACQPGSFELSPLHVASVYSLYIEETLPGVDYDFWQPPKLG